MSARLTAAALLTLALSACSNPQSEWEGNVREVMPDGLSDVSIEQRDDGAMLVSATLSSRGDVDSLMRGIDRNGLGQPFLEVLEQREGGDRLVLSVHEWR